MQFSALSLCSNPCIGPLPKIKMFFFLLTIFVDELISIPKIIAFLPVPLLFLLNCSFHVFKRFLRCTAKKLSTGGFSQVILLRNLWSVYKICKSFSSFSFSLYYTLQWLLTEAYLEPGRTSTMKLSFANIYNGFRLLTIFVRKTPSKMFDWVENRLLAKGLKY